MVILPPGFVATHIVGYFWSIPEKRLYSIKSGMLKKIKRRHAFRSHPEGYVVSHNGMRRRIPDNKLAKLTYPKSPQIIPVES